MKAAVIEGLGVALPPSAVTNDDLAARSRFATDDEWIRTRTGVHQRYWVDDGLITGDLAVEAGARAMKSAGVDTVDVLLVATMTPDQPCPAMAPDIAARLGLGTIAAFDVSAACAGFVYGLATAAGLITAAVADRVLVIGAETLSTVLDPDDRGAGVVLGDGAGAVVVRAGEDTEAGALLGFELGSDGTNRELITIPAGGARSKAAGRRIDPSEYYFHMDGKQVFTHAVQRMSQASATLLDRLAWSRESVDRVVPHQANARILAAVAEHLEIPPAKIVSNIADVGNTSSASIPLAIADAIGRKGLNAGERVVLTGFGGGLAWGATALVWPDGIVPV